MARTYPHTLEFNQCLGAKENPCAFSSIYLEDLRSGEREYLSMIGQLITALPKTEDPASRIALRGHITPAGQPCLRHYMRAVLWWLLPSDGEFRRAPHALHYYLARQGRCVVLRGGNVTRAFYESRGNWVVDHALPASRRPLSEASSAPTPALSMPPSGDVPQPPRRQKSRRRRRGKAAHKANQLPASRQADVTAPAERTANDNSAHWRATRPRSAANDRPKMRSTPVEHPRSFTSSPLSQLPIPAANQNSELTSCRDHSEIWGLYKPAQTDPRQDLTATHSRDNISGFGLSSPALQQPSTKPFSGLPSRQLMTSPHREAGEAARERPGIVYPLLPRTTHPDTRLTIDAAALPESAALDRRSRPPTVLDIGETSLQENRQPSLSRRQPRKRRRNRSAGLYRAGHQSARHREVAGVNRHPLV